MNVRTATPTPNRPIELAILSSFTCNGVYSTSPARSASVFPIWVNGPTARTKAFAFPDSVNELFRIKGH